jgi:hypothetical protein
MRFLRRSSRLRRKRPGDRSPAEQRDELPPPHANSSPGASPTWAARFACKLTPLPSLLQSLPARGLALLSMIADSSSFNRRIQNAHRRPSACRRSACCAPVNAPYGGDVKSEILAMIYWGFPRKQRSQTLRSIWEQDAIGRALGPIQFREEAPQVSWSRPALYSGNTF